MKTRRVDIIKIRKRMIERPGRQKRSVHKKEVMKELLKRWQECEMYKITKLLRKFGFYIKACNIVHSRFMLTFNHPELSWGNGKGRFSRPCSCKIVSVEFCDGSLWLYSEFEQDYFFDELYGPIDVRAIVLNNGNFIRQDQGEGKIINISPEEFSSDSDILFESITKK